MTLRPHTAEDLEFLCALYATTRERELALVDWTDDQKAAFVRMQFEAQHAHYTRYYGGADLDVVLERGERIGRLYVHRSAGELRLMEVTLLPERRGRGVGGALTEELLAEAAGSGRLVVLHVEDDNPAKRLYERLGFVEAGVEGIYRRMEWRPDGGAPAPGR